MNQPEPVYILCKEVSVAQASSGVLTLFGISWGSPKIEGDEWKDENENSKKEPKVALQFVCQAKTPQKIATEVRKAPLEKYFLFHGTITPVQIAMPVFVGGKNLETLNKEWNERED